MVTIKQLVADLKRHSVGLIIGGVVGLIAAGYTISQGVDLTTIAESGKGLLDSAMGRSAAVDIAKTKIYIVFGTLGAALGFVTDKLMK